ncbi:major facilitator superfamily domain-containing protein 10 isoform X2 [Candoia aspera]|uniref:major facilitator superfamily domain-containing protein 10 isoform X2 n=1 Tax=Candoia aspera TaxID=51853 RepID=UPI002FD7C437
MPRGPGREACGAEDGSSHIILVVFLSLLIDLLGFTLILPLLPSILDHYSKSDDGLYSTVQAGVDWFSRSLGIPPERKYNSVLFGGLISSLFSLLQFLASPLTGAASDSFGRRPALLATVLGLIASYSLWAISRSFELFLCSRIIGGISRGNVSLSTAVIADLQCPKARSKGMVPSVISGFKSAFNLISPWALFQFSAIRQKMGGPSRDSLKILGLVYFLYLFLFSGLEYSLSFLVHQHFHFSSLDQGKMFFFIGVTMAVIQGGYTRQIKPGEELKVVKRAIMLSAPGFLLTGWSNNVIILGTGLLFYSFAAAVVVPCLSTAVSSYGPDSQKGTVMGILRSLGALARALGPVASATVYWLAGAKVCFTVCASLFLLPFGLLQLMQKESKEE